MLIYSLILIDKECYNQIAHLGLSIKDNTLASQVKLHEHDQNFLCYQGSQMMEIIQQLLQKKFLTRSKNGDLISDKKQQQRLYRTIDIHKIQKLIDRRPLKPF